MVSDAWTVQQGRNEFCICSPGTQMAEQNVGSPKLPPNGLNRITSTYCLAMEMG